MVIVGPRGNFRFPAVSDPRPTPERRPTRVKLRLILSLLLALVATVTHAQDQSDAGGTAVLPVYKNGQVEGLLLLEPSPLPQLPAQRIISPAPGRNLLMGRGLQ